MRKFIPIPRSFRLAKFYFFFHNRLLELTLQFFRGFMAQEFVPTKDPLTSLRAAVKLCTV